jgi:hypothetical protein
MNRRSQMQGGKNRILPKEINANRSYGDFHWLEIWKILLCPSMGPEWRKRDNGLWRQQILAPQMLALYRTEKAHR